MSESTVPPVDENAEPEDADHEAPLDEAEEEA